MKMKSIIDTKLESYLKSDIKLVGLPTDFTLDFKGFSKRYYGRYYIQEKRIVVFIHDEQGNQLPYHEILDTVLHEAIHHYQHHHDKGFIRLKGVMHNLDFHKTYEESMNKLIDWEVIPCA